jgi:2-polyprenyl-3-methyl-5-hydroxy-6-metoxy-1,4-benzoquinol methylase
LKNLDADIRSKIAVRKEDVTKLTPVKLYDTIIAYGLLHCLTSIIEVDKVIDFMKSSLKPDGIVIIVSFNNQIKVPDVQDYLEPTLLPVNHLKNAFKNWLVLDYEHDVITETHPTSQVEHQHSLTRIIAKKVTH